MPGMTGLEIATRLHAEGCATPIIMFSGAVDRKLETRAFSLGISRVISKALGGFGRIIRQCIAESRHTDGDVVERQSTGAFGNVTHQSNPFRKRFSYECDPYSIINQLSNEPCVALS